MDRNEATSIVLRAHGYDVIFQLLDVDSEGIVSMAITLNGLVFGKPQSFETGVFRSIATWFTSMGPYFRDHIAKLEDASPVYESEWLNKEIVDAGIFFTEDFAYRFRAGDGYIERGSDDKFTGWFELLTQLNVRSQAEEAVYLGFESQVDVNEILQFLDKLMLWLQAQ